MLTDIMLGHDKHNFGANSQFIPLFHIFILCFLKYFYNWATAYQHQVLSFLGWLLNILFLIINPGSSINITVPQASNCSTPGYVSYNIGDGTCYKYFSEVVKQYEAEIRCLQDNARLVSLNNSNTLTILKALMGYEFITIFSFFLSFCKVYSFFFWYCILSIYVVVRVI